MPPNKHALLGASGSSQWSNCTPSALLNKDREDEETPYMKEGTEAHELCEHRLNQALERPTEDPRPDMEYYDREMEECADEYVAYVMNIVETAKEEGQEPFISIEQRVDFSPWVPEGFGTSDCIILLSNRLTVIDYKYGKGVEVTAENNSQMRLYALGAVNLFDGIYDIDEIQMIIFQPRKGNISEAWMSKDELLKWAEEKLMPKAQLAYEGKGEFKSGPWCRFCKAGAECRKRAEANLALEQYEYKVPPLLTPKEVGEILKKVDMLVNWASDIKEYALKQAIQGTHWDGWKLVAGRSNRKYLDENQVAKVVEDAGFDPYEKKLLTVTAMQKMLGKDKFNELLGSFIIKPTGKPTLVPESDVRPEVTMAKVDFMEENV